MWPGRASQLGTHQNGFVVEGTIGPKVTAGLPDIDHRPTGHYGHSTTVLRLPHRSDGFDFVSRGHIGSRDSRLHLVMYDSVVEGGTVYLDIWRRIKHVRWPVDDAGPAILVGEA